jgi:hypothetical protein
MAVRITCISKSGGYHENPHVAISSFGWLNEETSQSGVSTRLDLYNWIAAQNGMAYVRDQYGNVAYLRPRISHVGNPFLQTEADGTPTDNLLRLPEC